jgi:hypothetical protein
MAKTKSKNNSTARLVNSSLKLKPLTAEQRQQIAAALSQIEVDGDRKSKSIHRSKKKSNKVILQQAMELATA